MADDIQISASIDPSGVKAGTAQMRAEVKAFANGAEMELKRIDKSAQRVFSKQTTGRGGNFGFRAGQVAMQAQDVAVQLQGGAKAATIIAQQGSQIASFFGPGGMILGGVLAIGAATASWLMDTEAEEKALEKINHRLEKMKAFNAAQESKIQDDKDATKEAKIRATQGDKAADAAKRRMDFEKKMVQLAKDAAEADMSNANASVKAARERFEAEEELIRAKEAASRQQARVQKEGDAINKRASEIMAGPAARSQSRREERAEKRAIRRAAEEATEAEDRAMRKEAPMGNTRSRGMTAAQKADRIAGRIEAAKLAKGKMKTDLSEESIKALVAGIEKLITK